ncbi:unnamed protein product [Withania somnifera]
MSVKMEVPPGFTKPADTCMQERKAGEMNSPAVGSSKRCSLREKNLFVSTHFLPCPRGLPKHRSHVTALQPLRRGPGRPRKQKSDENPASEPLRRRPGRPRKQRSDGTEAPAASPAAPPSGSNGDVPLRVSATTNASEPVAQSPRPVPPLGSSSDRPLEVEEAKSKLNPLLRLKKPPKKNHTPQMLDEELKKVILKVECLLVRKLLTSGNDIDCMVHQANTTFTYLKGFGVDYGSFYRDIREYIEHRYNLHDAEREETSLSFSVWGGNYLNAMRSANDAEEVMVRTQEEHEKVKEKMRTIKRQIENLKQELAHIEHEDERLKCDIIKYIEAHEVAEAKKQELGTHLEEAQAKLREIKQRKNAALVGIESTTQRLECTYH